MTNSSLSATEHGDILEIFGIAPGELVQELGWDEDIDFTVRDSLEDAVGEELLTEDDLEPADTVLMWWRSDDGDVTDLGDALVDAQHNLQPGSPIWLLTPKTVREDHVTPADVTEAAGSVGLRVCGSALQVSEEWSATKLAPATRQ